METKTGNLAAKRAVVTALEWACARLDAIPVYRRGTGWGSASWGCYPFNLALRSAELDERWGTGVWRTSTAEDRAEWDGE